jgi:acylphosphatase
MTDEVITMNIRIEGDVQGIGFRDFAIREANARRLKGWVRNRMDGSVEAVASGPRTVVESFITACIKGPRGGARHRFQSDADRRSGFARLYAAPDGLGGCSC